MGEEEVGEFVQYFGVGGRRHMELQQILQGSGVVKIVLDRKPR